MVENMLISRIERSVSCAHQCNIMACLTNVFIFTVAMENMEFLQSVETLDFTHNNIDFVEDLSDGQELWNLLLGYNGVCSMCVRRGNVYISPLQLTSLHGLDPFVGFGILDLSSNQLRWTDVQRLSALHIIDLRLFGNVHLEKDSHCLFDASMSIV